MPQPATQFDALTQITDTLDRFELITSEAASIVPRMLRLAAKLRDELDAIRSERERLSFYNERDAAIKLGMPDDPTSDESIERATALLADRRRRLKLPHIEYGYGKIRYSDQHLCEIAAIFEVRGQRKPSAVSRQRSAVRIDA